MIVHPGSTNAIGLLVAVKAPVRRPDGTRNIKFTVAAFRPWRGSPASIASDPTFNAALRFAYPRHRLPGEFSPARAGCWCREPLPPRLARPNLSKKPKRRMIDCLPNHPAFVQKLESLYRVTAPCQPLPKCDQNQISLSGRYANFLRSFSLVTPLRTKIVSMPASIPAIMSVSMRSPIMTVCSR